MAQTVASPNLASGLPIGPITPGWWQLFHFANNPLAVIDKAHRFYGNAFTLNIAGYGRFVMLSDTTSGFPSAAATGYAWECRSRFTR
jgi:hypothetical protein